jgi:hypothetical protein
MRRRGDDLNEFFYQALGSGIDFGQTRHRRTSAPRAGRRVAVRNLLNRPSASPDPAKLWMPSTFDLAQCTPMRPP